MNSQYLQKAAELAGRSLLGLLFVIEAFSKLAAYDGALRYMAAYAMPALLLPPAIALEFVAGLLLIVGWQTRLAAFALAAFCIVAALIFHTRLSDTNEFIHFLKDFALAGAFLVLAARGAGPWSLDARWSRKPM